MAKTKKPLSCPRCHKKDILVNEVIEAISQHKIINGVWKHYYDNNEYGVGIRIDCKCDNCGHAWRSRKGLDFSDYFIEEE